MVFLSRKFCSLSPKFYEITRPKQLRKAIKHGYRHAARHGRFIRCASNVQYIDMDEEIRNLGEDTPDFDPEYIWVSCNVTIRWKVKNEY